MEETPEEKVRREELIGKYQREFRDAERQQRIDRAQRRAGDTDPRTNDERSTPHGHHPTRR